MTKEQWLKAFQRVIDSEPVESFKESLIEEMNSVKAMPDDEFQELMRRENEDG